MPHSVARRAAESLARPSVLAVFVLVAIWNVSVSTDFLQDSDKRSGALADTLREVRDLNLHTQLRLYQVLIGSRSIGLHPDNVVLVYIDDDTHWGSELRGESPTDRRFLARVIRGLSTQSVHAEAIGIDVELLAPKDYPEGTDDESRKAANQDLLNAIHEATREGIPVVLGGAFANRDGHNVRLPEIFSQSDLTDIGGAGCQPSACPAIGYVNAPDDKRHIPLQKEVLTGKMDSFALAVVRSIRPSLLETEPMLTRESHTDPAEDAEEVLGTFLPEKRFPSVLANDLDKPEIWSNKIALVGGHWHDLQGAGAMVDSHISPAGRMSGLSLHANYVESLLQHQFTHELSLPFVLTLDVLLGLCIYLAFEMLSGWRVLFLLLAASLLPFFAAWIFLLTKNVYLDFLFPIELYVLHILYELGERRVHRAWGRSRIHDTESIESNPSV